MISGHLKDPSHNYGVTYFYIIMRPYSIDIFIKNIMFTFAPNNKKIHSENLF